MAFISLHNAGLCVSKETWALVSSTSAPPPPTMLHTWPWVAWGASHLFPRATGRLSSQMPGNFEYCNFQLEITRTQFQFHCYWLSNLGQIT